MNFGFTPEQNQLREQVRRFLDDNAPMPEVRKISATEAGFSRDLWKKMAELGWLGLIVAEANDGLGLNWVDVTVVLEETGRSLFPSPFISHTLSQSLMIDAANDEQKARWLPASVSGAKVLTFALLDEPDVYQASGVTLQAQISGTGYTLTGSKRFVADALAADQYLVAFRAGPAGDVRIALVDRQQTGVSVSGYPTMDATKRAGTLRLDGVQVSGDAVLAKGDFSAIARLLDRAAVAVTVEAVGAAEQAVGITSGYARDRIQFGAPIGKYQGVKHRLAEMYVDVESAKSLAYYAAWCIDHSPKELVRSASLAKGYASETFPALGINGVQLHGAIGFTAEYDIQLYLKRTKWLRAVFGDADYHYERVAVAGGV